MTLSCEPMLAPLEISGEEDSYGEVEAMSPYCIDPQLQHHYRHHMFRVQLAGEQAVARRWPTRSALFTEAPRTS